MTWRWRWLLVTLVLFVAACGGGDDGDDESSAPTTAAVDGDDAGASDAASSGATGTCSLEVTGGVEFSTDQPGRVPAFSDYWLDDAKLQSAAQVHDDYDARVAAGQQLFQIFQVACGDPEGILLSTTDLTTRSDVPQGPGTYSVLNFLDKDKPGISAAIVVPDDLFGVTGGEVVITRFDDEGVAGTFDLVGEELSISADQGAEPKTITITGSFDMPCWTDTGACS